MHIVKFLSFLLLALYLIVVGLGGLGVNVGFVHPGVLGFVALAAGVLFFYRAIKHWGCCNHCDVDKK